MDGCYLLCTPKFQSDNEPEPVSGSTAEDQVLDTYTRQLISDFLKRYTGLSEPIWHQSEALSTMKRVVDDRLDKYSYYYNGMRNELLQTTLDDSGDDVSFVQAVARNVFSDGNTSWDRIGCLLAFGATVCQCYITKGRENCVERGAQEISTYLLSDQRDWLVRNNGWNGFVDFFSVPCPETSERNTVMANPNPKMSVKEILMAFVGLAGITAVLVSVIVIIIISVQ